MKQTFLVACAAIALQFPAHLGAEPAPDVEAVLGRSLSVLTNARTLYFEATRRQQGDNIREKYYLQNDNGSLKIRVESSVVVSWMHVDTLYIKNDTGIWEVDPDQAIEVSKAFAADNLLAVYPFFRMLLIPGHAYELDVSERSSGGTDYVDIKGKLAGASGTNGPDIAKQFEYTIVKTNGYLAALHETTFGKRSLDMQFEKFQTDLPLDPHLFDLPANLKRTVAANRDDFLNLRMHEVKVKMSSAEFQKHARVTSREKRSIQVVLLLSALSPVGIWAYKKRTRK